MANDHGDEEHAERVGEGLALNRALYEGDGGAVIICLAAIVRRRRLVFSDEAIGDFLAAVDEVRR